MGKTFHIEVRRTYTLELQFPEGSSEQMQHVFVHDFSNYTDCFTNVNLHEMVHSGYLAEVNEWAFDGEELSELIEMARNTKVISIDPEDYEAKHQLIKKD